MRFQPKTSRAGFTLIEILAVMMILAILSVFLMNSGVVGVQSVEIKNTETFVQTLSALAEDYENEHGGYPPSTFADDLEHKPTKTNEGIESLVITLWRDGADWQAREVDEGHLVNTDGDTTRKSVTTYSSADAFELGDVWGNPIAYIHRRDYGKEFLYLTYDEDGNEVENRVVSMDSEKTGDPFRKRSFQLISAGSDGIFGTEDDIANFEFRN